MVNFGLQWQTLDYSYSGKLLWSPNKNNDKILYPIVIKHILPKIANSLKTVYVYVFKDFLIGDFNFRPVVDIILFIFSKISTMVLQD